MFGGYPFAKAPFAGSTTTSGSAAGTINITTTLSGVGQATAFSTGSISSTNTITGAGKAVAFSTGSISFSTTLSGAGQSLLQAIGVGTITITTTLNGVSNSIDPGTVNTPMQITSATIVSLCAKLAALSSNQANLATGDFLDFANLSQASIVSEIMAAREEHLITQSTVPVVSGQTAYRIPYRAINGDIRHLWFEDAAGSRYRLWQKDIADIEDYAINASGVPTGFFITGNWLNLLPAPNVSGNLVIAYPFRPNLLVDASTCQQITNINGNVLTVSSIPANFENGGLYDIVDQQSGNGIIGYDLQGSISGNTITFSSLPNNVSVGNWLCMAGETPVPMNPEESHPLLLEMTVMRTEMVRGNAPRIKNSAALIQDARRAFDLLLQNRVISKGHAAGGLNPLLPGRGRPF